METPTGQEETAILLEEYARRIATLQESLKQAGRIRPNEAVILQEIKRVVEERNDLKRRLERAEAVKESLTSALRDIKKNVDDWNLQDYVTIRRLVNTALRTAEESSVVDRTPAKHPEGTTKLDKALQNTTVVKRVLVENSCPSEFELEDCEFNPESGCTLCCEDCWNEEVGE
jgi:predicted  nucleic acid-binding Zn-ribbon protein